MARSGTFVRIPVPHPCEHHFQKKAQRWYVVGILLSSRDQEPCQILGQIDKASTTLQNV